MRMAMTAAVHLKGDRTRTAVDAALLVGGSVEQNVDVLVSQTVEQTGRGTILSKMITDRAFLFSHW